MNSKLPTAVRKAAERARKQAAADGDPANTETVGDVAEAAEPTSEIAPEVTPSVPAAQEPAAPIQAEPIIPPVKAERIDPENYLERYKTLKVYHDKTATTHNQEKKTWGLEKADLSTKVSNLESQNAALVTEISDLKVQLKTAGSTEVQASQPANLDFSDDELAALGDEGAKMVASIVGRMTPAPIQAPPIDTAKPEQVQESGGKMTAQEEARFFNGLNGLVPKWEAVQNMPGFNQWMNTVNPQTGASPDMSLQSSFQMGDYVSAASIYQDFLSANRASVKTPKPEELVMPGGQRGTEVPDETPVFSIGEFNDVKRQIAMLKTKITSNRHKAGDPKRLADLQVREEQLSRAYEQTQ